MIAMVSLIFAFAFVVISCSMWLNGEGFQDIGLATAIGLLFMILWRLDQK